MKLYVLLFLLFIAEFGIVELQLDALQRKEAEQLIVNHQFGLEIANHSGSIGDLYTDVYHLAEKKDAK